MEKTGNEVKNALSKVKSEDEPNKETVLAINEGEKLLSNKNAQKYDSIEELRDALEK